MRLVMAAALLTLAALYIGATSASADDGQHLGTEMIPLDGSTAIEKTRLLFYAPEDNTLPWAYVKGKIANHVAGYPVIIQIHELDGSAVHFAQTDVNEAGEYEYKFRVRNVHDGVATNIFEGYYQVTIFKVVYHSSLETV